MKILLICISIVVAVTAQGGYNKQEEQQIIVRGARYTVQAGPQNQLQASQYHRVAQTEEDGNEDTTPQASLAYRRPYEQDPPRKFQSKNQYEIKDGKKTPLEEEEEIEEPDRLSLLLPDSTFTCQGRATGYYADEGLACEVFHYCQEGAKHSWICPEGFSFHQVHLICMPPSSENICDQSSQYHFVNDFLYKPLNEDEANSRPNTSLKYADRYYPETVHQSPDRATDRTHQRQPLQVGLPSRKHQIQQQQLQQSTATSAAYRHAPSQVFRSPEEVNIPLQQRRPVQHTYDVQDFSYDD